MGGVCDTLEIQVFLRFSGELVSFEELGQLDLIKVLLSFLVLPMGTRSPIDPVCIGFILGPLENEMPP